MKKEQLMARGLSEEHARIAVEVCKAAFKGFVPKTRFDAVNEKLKAANAVIASYSEVNDSCKEGRNDGEIRISLDTNKIIEITLKGK